MSQLLAQYWFSGTVVFLAVAVVILLFILLWAGISYWVYTDARERGMEKAAFWAVLTFVGNVIGLLVYLFVREG